MYVKSTKFQIMPDEPALGTITENELIAKKFEVEDYLLDEAIEDRIIREYYDFGDFAIETSQYLDYDAVQEYLDELEMTGADLDMERLYDEAGVIAPSRRRG